jgi:selenide,water dikinase
VAAQHSLSDIYAAGGLPVSSLALLGIPRDLPVEIPREALSAVARICETAGSSLSGGHTWYDEEARLGLAVVGRLIEHRISVSGGQPGDRLWLTKPIGLGILTTWHAATGEPIDEAVKVMLDSNENACRSAVAAGIVCGTDVSGYGLLGSARAIAEASGITAVIRADAVPIVDGAMELSDAGILSGGTLKNISWMREVSKLDSLRPGLLACLCDSQTSGGLLLAGEEAVGVLIGELVSSSGPTVIVR